MQRMTVLMATMTKCFQVSWVIRSTFVQLKDMVAMTLFIGHRITAILADTAIALIDVLLQRYPEVNGHPRVPGEALTGKFVYCESCHVLPYQATPRRALPRRAMPGRAEPSLALTTMVSMPYLTVPNHAMPHPIQPHTTGPHPALPQLALPYRALTTKVIYEPRNG